MAAQKKRLVTVNALGVSAKANPDALDDYDLFESIVENGESNAASLIAVGKALFGEKGWKEATDGLRDEKGKLTITRVGEFLDAATEQIEALKN